jgi:hypothetical protein
MRWYDYLICLMAADHITAGIMQMNLMLILLGVVGYVLWEKYRKDTEDGNSHSRY